MTNTEASPGELRMNRQRLALIDLGFLKTHGFCYSWTGTGRKVEFGVLDEESTWSVGVFRWVSPRTGRGFFEEVCRLTLNSVPDAEFVAVARALQAVSA